MDSRQAVYFLNSLVDVPALLLVADLSELVSSSALSDLAGYLHARVTRQRPSLTSSVALETPTQILQWCAEAFGHSALPTELSSPGAARRLEQGHTLTLLAFVNFTKTQLDKLESGGAAPAAMDAAAPLAASRARRSVSFASAASGAAGGGGGSSLLASLQDLDQQPVASSSSSIEAESAAAAAYSRLLGEASASSAAAGRLVPDWYVGDSRVRITQPGAASSALGGSSLSSSVLLPSFSASEARLVPARVPPPPLPSQEGRGASAPAPVGAGVTTASTARRSSLKPTPALRAGDLYPTQQQSASEADAAASAAAIEADVLAAARARLDAVKIRSGDVDAMLTTGGGQGERTGARSASPPLATVRGGGGASSSSSTVSGATRLTGGDSGSGWGSVSPGRTATAPPSMSGTWYERLSKAEAAARRTGLGVATPATHAEQEQAFKYGRARSPSALLSPQLTVVRAPSPGKGVVKLPGGAGVAYLAPAPPPPAPGMAGATKRGFAPSATSSSAAAASAAPSLGKGLRVGALFDPSYVPRLAMVPPPGSAEAAAGAATAAAAAAAAHGSATKSPGGGRTASASKRDGPRAARGATSASRARGKASPASAATPAATTPGRRSASTPGRATSPSQRMVTTVAAVALEAAAEAAAAAAVQAAQQSQAPRPHSLASTATTRQTVASAAASAASAPSRGGVVYRREPSPPPQDPDGFTPIQRTVVSWVERLGVAVTREARAGYSAAPAELMNPAVPLGVALPALLADGIMLGEVLVAAEARAGRRGASMALRVGTPTGGTSVIQVLPGMILPRHGSISVIAATKNLELVLGGLRAVPRVPSRHLWAVEALRSGAAPEVAWGLLEDVYRAYVGITDGAAPSAAAAKAAAAAAAAEAQAVRAAAAAAETARLAGRSGATVLDDGISSMTAGSAGGRGAGHSEYEGSVGGHSRPASSAGISVGGVTAGGRPGVAPGAASVWGGGSVATSGTGGFSRGVSRAVSVATTSPTSTVSSADDRRTVQQQQSWGTAGAAAPASSLSLAQRLDIPSRATARATAGAGRGFEAPSPTTGVLLVRTPSRSGRSPAGRGSTSTPRRAASATKAQRPASVGRGGSRGSPASPRRSVSTPPKTTVAARMVLPAGVTSPATLRLEGARDTGDASHLEAGLHAQVHACGRPRTSVLDATLLPAGGAASARVKVAGPDSGGSSKPYKVRMLPVKPAPQSVPPDLVPLLPSLKLVHTVDTRHVSDPLSVLKRVEFPSPQSATGAASAAAPATPASPALPHGLRRVSALEKEGVLEWLRRGGLPSPLLPPTAAAWDKVPHVLDHTLCNGAVLTEVVKRLEPNCPPLGGPRPLLPYPRPRSFPEARANIEAALTALRVAPIALGSAPQEMHSPRSVAASTTVPARIPRPYLWCCEELLMGNVAVAWGLLFFLSRLYTWPKAGAAGGGGSASASRAASAGSHPGRAGKPGVANDSPQDPRERDFQRSRVTLGRGGAGAGYGGVGEAGEETGPLVLPPPVEVPEPLGATPILSPSSRAGSRLRSAMRPEPGATAGSAAFGSSNAFSSGLASEPLLEQQPDASQLEPLLARWLYTLALTPEQQQRAGGPPPTTLAPFIPGIQDGSLLARVAGALLQCEVPGLKLPPRDEAAARANIEVCLDALRLVDDRQLSKRYLAHPLIADALAAGSFAEVVGVLYDCLRCLQEEPPLQALPPLPARPRRRLSVTFQDQTAGPSLHSSRVDGTGNSSGAEAFLVTERDPRESGLHAAEGYPDPAVAGATARSQFYPYASGAGFGAGTPAPTLQLPTSATVVVGSSYGFAAPPPPPPSATTRAAAMPTAHLEHLRAHTQAALSPRSRGAPSPRALTASATSASWRPAASSSASSVVSASPPASGLASTVLSVSPSSTLDGRVAAERAAYAAGARAAGGGSDRYYLEAEPWDPELTRATKEAATLVAWLTGLGIQLQHPEHLRPGCAKAPEFTDGTLLMRVIEKCEAVKGRGRAGPAGAAFAGAERRPKTGGACLANIRRVLDALRANPAMPLDYLYSEHELRDGNVAVIRPLLMQIRKAFGFPAGSAAPVLATAAQHSGTRLQ